MFAVYYKEGFLAVQRILERVIVLEHNSSADVDDIQVLLQRFPFPPYLEDKLVKYVIYYNLSFIMVLCLLVVVPNMAKEVVLEKEYKLKVTSYTTPTNK